jgi:hypothetical protein
VLVQQVGQEKKLYLALFESGKIYQCPIIAIDGTIGSTSLTACTLIRDAPATSTHGLAIYSATTPSIPTTMYLTNFNDRKIYVCKMNADGTIVASPACAEKNTSTFSGGVQGVTVFRNYLYTVTNLSAAIVCPINSTDGSLGTCTRTASTNATGNSSFAAIGNSRSVAFYDSGSTVFAYISNNTGNSVYGCTWNSSNGLLHTCSTISAGTLSAPRGITIATSLDDQARIYITNGSANPYYVICQINKLTGSVGGCTTSSNVNSTKYGFRSPEDIYIQDF